MVNGEPTKVHTVILDGVASQANRMELALQDAIDRGEVKLPVVTVDFASTDNPGVPRVTSFQAPHRIADAILRDSTLNGVAFRKSEIGKELDRVSLANATPPAALLSALHGFRHVGQHRAAWRTRK